MRREGPLVCIVDPSQKSPPPTPWQPGGSWGSRLGGGPSDGEGGWGSGPLLPLSEPVWHLEYGHHNPGAGSCHPRCSRKPRPRLGSGGGGPGGAGGAGGPASSRPAARLVHPLHCHCRGAGGAGGRAQAQTDTGRGPPGSSAVRGLEDPTAGAQGSAIPQTHSKPQKEGQGGVHVLGLLLR